MTDKHILYGMLGSLYTGKVRAYLRQQGIPFVERGTGHPHFHNEIIPVIGRFIMPVVQTPQGEIIQDGTVILDHFEAGNLRKSSILPENQTLRAISFLFELFGGEGLLRPAMHYRWNFDDDNLDFLRSSFKDVFPPGLNEEEAEQAFLHGSGRMRQAAVSFGVIPETFGLIESSYRDFLLRFNRHLGESSFLLGGHATIGDFGLFNALYAHLARDPHPALLMKKIAPRVYAWVERMNGPEEFQDHTVNRQGPKLFSNDEVPESLLDMMRYVRDEYLLEITAHVEFTNSWLLARPEIEPGTPCAIPLGANEKSRLFIGRAGFSYRGVEIETMVMPYRFLLLQRLQDCFNDATDDDQAMIRKLFRQTGLEPLLDMRTHLRVERENHLEVWGGANEN